MKQLNKGEIQEINKQIEVQYGLSAFFKKKDNLFVDEKAGQRLLVKDKQALFFYTDGKIVPTLKLLLKKNFLKIVTVDMGAVKFVAAGADIMRPGIVNIELETVNGDFVVIEDVKNHKPLAVAQAMYDADEMKLMEKGKVLKNLHYVGDKIWNC